MKIFKLLFLLTFFYNSLHSQNSKSITGIVTEQFTNTILQGATVSIKGDNFTTSTDHNGYFVIKNISAINIVLVISYVGYETQEFNFTDKSNKLIEVQLVRDEKTGSEVVVSASKRQETIVNAPASIQVIRLKDLEQFAGSNVGELVSKIQGIEFTRYGVDGITFNARGFNSAFNNKVFQLVDSRNSMGALSGSLPVFNNGSTNKEDIEQIEIILGPQTALYGPNAHNAVFNTITKDPRKYQGTTVAITAGNRYQFSGRFRQATKINNKWAYKLLGEYAVGKEFEFYDSVYAGGAVFGPAVSIPERNVDFNFRHIRGEGHIYYSISPKVDIILSGGGSSNNGIQVTTSGRNQIRGLGYSFLQAKLVTPSFFANIYNTWGTLGTSYPMPVYTRDYWNRTHSTLPSSDPLRGRLSPDSAEQYAMRLGNVFKERSHRFNAEAQYKYTFQQAGIFLMAGVNLQEERPNSFGINLVDKIEKIKITQYGGVLQFEKSLPLQLRFVSALRIDKHSNFGDFFSPKLGIIKSIDKGSFRITWGKAYAMPSILTQYANINGVLYGNGVGIKYIPNLSRLSDPLSVRTTIPLLPEQVSTLEFGYKGMVTKKLFIDINYYTGISKNFLSPAQFVGGRILSVGDIAVTPSNAGIVQNDTLKNASFLTYFNYGDVKAYGMDAGLNYQVNDKLYFALKYSWFGSDISKENIKNDANKDGFVSPEEKSLNAPKNRGVFIVGLQNLSRKKIYLTIAARYVGEYDFYSGNQVGTKAGEGSRGIIIRPGLPPILKNFDWGPLGGFTTLDLSAGFKLNEMASIGMGVSNIFDTRQIELVASPSIGRLFSIELKVHVPNGKN